MPMALKDKQTEKNKHFVASLEFALQGIQTVFKEERNMRTHLLAAIVAVICGFVFKVSIGEWLWLILSIFLVFVVEIVNTAFENVVDMITDFHFHPIGKKIKDMAAGAVLAAAIFSMIVGLIIFLPKLWELFRGFLQY